MRYLLILLTAALLTQQTAYAQKIDRKLQEQLIALCQNFNGDIGFYVKNLRTGKIAHFNADTLFPTASMIKIPILYGIYDKINRGELSESQELIYRDSLHYAGIDILGSYKQNEKITLSRVVMLMLTVSDNTASLWLQSLAGGGDRINEILAEKGFNYTRVNSRTTGRQEDWKLYGWGQTTPKEMAKLMELIVNQQLVSDSADSRMLRQLGRNFFDHVSNREIPPNIFVASKNGAVNASRSEVLYVNAGRNPYVFCITTKNNEDKSWTDDNEAWVLARKLSACLWQYYSN